MAYLLNFVYLAVILLAAPWLLYKALRTGKYRAGFSEKFFGRVPVRAGNAPCLWLHAVSVGEVTLVAPLLAEIRRSRPDWQCVVSATSLTGFTLAKKKFADCTVFYCPLDFSWAVRTAMRRVRPDCLVLMELELWPNLIRAAQQSGARVAIANGRLSERSARGYGRLQRFVRPIIARLDLIAAQNAEYAERFRALGANPAALHVTGSIKFDGAQTDRQNKATVELRRLAGIGPDDLVFLAGSTQQPEEQLAVETFRALAPGHPQLRLIVVPRHPERFEEVAALLNASGLAWQRRSRLPIEGANPRARILLVDTIGELGAWWGTANVAFVGGSLHPRGGQNMIEPAAYGAAVSFGPNTKNFRDVVAQMIAADCAEVVHDGAELTAFVRRSLEDRATAEALGRRAQALVSGQLGATRRTLDLLAALIDRPAAVENCRPTNAAA